MVRDVSPPTCFISYSWDSEDHKEWVRMLAESLRENGVDIKLDQWDLRYGDDLAQFMEESIRESSRVILVCTPNFARKANKGEGGVGYEKSIVTGELFYDAPRAKFIPLLRSGSASEALPSYLKSKVYIDFSNSSEFSERLEDLLHELHESARYQRPPLGARPSFRTSQVERSLSDAETEYCSRCGALPGSRSICSSLYGDHNFTSASGVVYCERCGVIPGSNTECTSLYGNHNFTSGSGRIFCERCGVGIGRVSTCTGLYGNHSFKSRG